MIQVRCQDCKTDHSRDMPFPRCRLLERRLLERTGLTLTQFAASLEAAARDLVAP